MRALFAALLLMVLLLSGCTTPTGEDFAPIASADWRPGYHFGTQTTMELSMDGIIRADGETQHLDEEIPSQVILTQERTVLAIDLGPADDPVYLVHEETTPEEVKGVGGGIELRPKSRIIGIRAADLLPVSASLTATKATFGKLEPNSHAMVKFPLARGESWATTISGLHEVMDISDEWQVSSAVEGMEVVPGPDGDVSAVRVQHDIEIPDLAELEAAMRDDAQDSGATLERFDLMVDASAVTHYAPSLHAIVRNEFVIDMMLDIAAESDGRSFEGRMHVLLHMTESLTEAQLTEGPAADLSSLLDEVVDELPELVPPPRPIPSPLGLGLETDVAAPNAAEAPTVTFTATTERPVGPADEVTIRLFDALGELVASSEGATLATPIGRMGSYRAVAEHRVDGGLQGRTVLELPVHYEKDEVVACDIILLGSCGAPALPVTPGLGRISLVAKGGLVGLPSTEMVVYDAADGEVAAAAFDVGGQASLEATAFDGADLSGPWSLRMEGPLLAPDGFTVHVLLEPLGAGPESPVTSAMQLWFADLPAN